MAPLKKPTPVQVKATGHLSPENNTPYASLNRKRTKGVFIESIMSEYTEHQYAYWLIGQTAKELTNYDWYYLKKYCPDDPRLGQRESP